VTSAGAIETAAEALGLRIVRRLDDSMFGAAIVERREGRFLVLKASAELKLDSGLRRSWDAQARLISRSALADLASLPNAFDETLRSVLDDTQDVVLSQTTIVHGDFHHRNILVEGPHVVGVFDWDIAGPGEWRFDLVSLAFACQMYPRTCEANALAAVTAAVREQCDAPTAAFLMACQTVRALSLLRTHRPDWLERASTRMQTTLAGWWA
jgi:Ser/Thr protein kinase RdoA (MazF antagonist)